MKTLQQGGPKILVHRCIVAYGLAYFAGACVISSLMPVQAREIEDFAQIFVNEYHEPAKSLRLSEDGRNKSLALAHFSRGLSLESKGQTSSAIDSYRKVLEYQPGEGMLARKTAHLMAQNSKPDEALKLLEKNLENNPNEAISFIALSEFLATYQSFQKESRERALTVIEEAVRKFPDDPNVYAHIVKLYLVSDRKDDAKTVMDRALERENPDPMYWLRLGQIAGRIWPVQLEGDSVEPVLLNRIYEKALARAGDDISVNERVGDFYHATRQFKNAEKIYTGIIKQKPDRLDLRQKLARVYGGMGDEEKVIDTLKEIVRIDPLDAVVHRQLGTIYLRKEDTPAAVPYLRKALEISKGSANDYAALAKLMIDAEMAEETVTFLKKASFLFPDSPDFPYLATYALAGQQKWGESIEFFIKTEKLAEKSKPQILNEAFFFRYAAAVERAAVDEKEKNGKDIKPEIDRSAKLFQKTIEMIAKNDPDDENREFTATVYNYLGYMWIENDMNIDEAGELIKTALDLDPESGAIADSLGWYYFKKGNYEEAKKELLRAEELIEEKDSVIFDHIGRVYFHLGDKARAVSYMEKAVELEADKKEYSERLKEFRKMEDKGPATPAEGLKPDEGAPPPAPPEKAADAPKAKK